MYGRLPLVAGAIHGYSYLNPFKFLQMEKPLVRAESMVHKRDKERVNHVSNIILYTCDGH